MKQHIHVMVKFKDYISYQEKYNTTYLDKKNGYNLWSPGKSFVLNGFKPVNEIYNGIETSYDIININTYDYLIKFITKSETEYRFDIIKEPSTNIYHLCFSTSDKQIDNREGYEKVTYKNESSEVLGKLSYILKDITPKLNVSEYCIGATGNHKKDNIYQYIMNYVSSWEKRNTDQYDLGWALYFKL